MTQLKDANGTAGLSFTDLLTAFNGKVPYAAVTEPRFGAVGDGVTDDTAAIQAAIDWVEDNLDLTRVVFFPAAGPGYLVSGITATTATLMGEQSARPVGGGSLSSDLGSRLIHKLGATTPLITLSGGAAGAFGWEKLHNLALFGKQNQNVAVPVRAIVSASDRRHFIVNTAHLPADPANADFPGYGVCVFYDAGGYRLGTGIVSTVNRGTGECTLYDGSDNYTGKTGTAGNLLSATEKVAFAATSTYVADGVTLTDIADHTMISPPAVLVAGRTKDLDNLYIKDFHCGVVMSDSTMGIGNVWTNGCGMAGLAQRAAGAGADVSGHGRWFFQGGGASNDIGQTATAVTRQDVSGHYGLCGMFGLPSKSTIQEIVCDEGYHGIIDKGGGGTAIGSLVCDKPFKEPIICWGGIYSGGFANNAVTIGSLFAYTIGQGLVAPSVLNFPGHTRAVVAIRGSNGRHYNVGALTASRFSTASLSGDDFDFLTNLYEAASNGTHEIVVASVPFREAAVGLATGVAPYSTSNVLSAPKMTNAEIAAFTWPTGTLIYNTDRNQLQTMSAAGGIGIVFLPKCLTGTATWDPASIAAGAQVTTTVTVSGAALGDPARVGFSQDLQGMIISAYVSAANTVTVVLRNGTAGALDLASGTLRAVIERWV